LQPTSPTACRKIATFYLSIAESQWNWFQQSGMINSKSLINDGLTSACKNNNGTVWSYNQGVILGALVELNKASPNTTYISTAKSIATAAIKDLSDSNGVLHDPCEPNCGADGSQFKGIFMRNLQILQAASPDNGYLSFHRDECSEYLGQGSQCGESVERRLGGSVRGECKREYAIQCFGCARCGGSVSGTAGERDCEPTVTAAAITFNFFEIR
jgi:hypothetical protein